MEVSEIKEAQISGKIKKKIPHYLKVLSKYKRKKQQAIAIDDFSKDLNIPLSVVTEDLEEMGVVTGADDLYGVRYLAKRIACFAGLQKYREAMVIGDGEMLNVFFENPGYKTGLIKAAALFSKDVSMAMKQTGNANILPLSRLKDIKEQMKLDIAVIAVRNTKIAMEIEAILKKINCNIVLNFSENLFYSKERLIYNCTIDNPLEEWFEEVVFYKMRSNVL